MAILLTGSSGFLGSNLLARIVSGNTAKDVLVLCRDASEDLAISRITEKLKGFFSDAEISLCRQKIKVIRGDITLPHLGLGEVEFAELAKNCDEIYHSAASISFSDSLESSRLVNVEGTRNILDILDYRTKNNLPQADLLYVSTAYVAGDNEGVFSANSLNLNRTFKNPYEQSKAEAEMLVRQNFDKGRVRIVRPSIIIGDSITGGTSSFNVLYVPTKFLAKGLLRALPANPLAPCDLVPVDYVARSIMQIAKMEEDLIRRH